MFTPTETILRPNATTDSGDWTSSSGDYDADIDDATTQPTAPNLTDYISCASASEIVFGLTDTIAVGQIAAEITVWLYGSQDATEAVLVTLYSGAWANTVSVTLTTTPGWACATLLNPGAAVLQGVSMAIEFQGLVSTAVIINAAYVDVLHSTSKGFAQANVLGNLVLKVARSSGE